MRSLKTWVAAGLQLLAAGAQAAANEDIDPGALVAAACSEGWAFGVELGRPIGAANLKVVKARVPWAGSHTVTAFSPATPQPPFSRFYVSETPLSHLAVWAMATAFHESEALARQAAGRLSAAYAAQLGKPDDEDYIQSVGSRSFRLPADRYLMVTINGSAVDVTCGTGGALFKQALDEAVALDRRGR